MHDLREDLHDLARTAIPSRSYETAIFQRAARLRRRRAVFTTGAAAVALATFLSIFRVLAAGPATLPAVPPDGPFLGWETAGEATFLPEATKVWNDTSDVHTGVRALLLTHDDELGAVAVLEGYDKNGAPRLAFLTGNRDRGGALTVRADRPAPDPATTRVVSLVSSRLTAEPGVASHAFFPVAAVAVAQPGMTSLQVESTSVDQVMSQGKPARFTVQPLPEYTTSVTTSVTAHAGSRQVIRVPADGGAIGDARAVPATVVSRQNQQLTVALPDATPVRAGQLAVVPEGLVGRIVNATPGRATIALSTSDAFTSDAYTAISNIPGTLQGTGGKLEMRDIIDPKQYVEPANRVLIPDPAQQDTTTGAITAGRTTSSPHGARTELTPPADPMSTKSLWIMTPYAPELTR